MYQTQARRRETLHLNYFKMNNAGNARPAEGKIIAFNKAAELSSKEEFCCSRATD